MQLYALLESIEAHITGLESMSIIYRSDDQEYENGYTIIQKRFNTAHYIRQSHNPHADFKPLLMKELTTHSAPYVVFAVDDIVITDTIDMSACAEALTRTHAYGFHLRLGLNIDRECFPRNDVPLTIPALSPIHSNIYTWKFITGDSYWGYPHTVDMAVMHKKDIIPLFNSFHFVSPNMLEGEWARRYAPVPHKYGLCFERSKMINIPMNIVQDNHGNPCLYSYSAADLIALFNQGYKIDIKPLYHIKNRTPHSGYTPTFIVRDDSAACVQKLE
jgi:hypothetical protein